MIIKNKNGEAYDLTPGTVLELERTNPFFNKYGEQSLPVTLPSTSNNRRLLIYPDNLAGVTKTSQRSDASISHGAFDIKCRQAILSASEKAGIETSFYINTGAFYEKIKDVQLSTIFEKKELVFSDVQEAISFVRGLMVTRDERFTCFPAWIKGRRELNKSSYPVQEDGYFSMYNATARTEEVDGKTISLDPGYYITPFIRANHLLSEIFAYFGYTMAPNFFTTTAPFPDMVFLNTNIDTIVTGRIRYSQIVPDCMVSTILDVFRNKFCCEFIPDEVTRTMNIVLFNEVITQTTNTDITHAVAGKPTINHPKGFRQVKLVSKRVDPDDESTQPRVMGTSITMSYLDVLEENKEFDTVVELLKKYPDAQFNQIIGLFFRTGYKGLNPVVQNLGYTYSTYYAGGTLDAVEKTSADLTPLLMYASLRLYIGEGRALNSSIVMSDGASVSNNSERKELSPMICFAVKKQPNFNWDYATILNYSASGSRLWDYTLANSGPDGLFERFWRKYDNMLRNSFLEVVLDLVLTDVEKVSLSEYKKVMYSGQELLPNVIRYAPGQVAKMESTFLTTKIYEPISEASPEADRLAGTVHPYKWQIESRRSPSGYTYFDFVGEPPTIYYAPPTVDQYQSGVKYHQKTYAVKMSNTTSDSGLVNPIDGTITTWLKAVLI